MLGVADPGEVLVVDESDDLDGVVERCRAEPRSGFLRVADGVRREQRVVQLAEVQAAQLGESGIVVALGMGELPVAFVHVEPAAVQPQIRRASTEELVELGVVGLTLLPAGRHHGHGRVRVQVAGDMLDARPSLRPEQGDGAVHATCTWTVRPTSSSIPRRTS